MNDTSSVKTLLPELKGLEIQISWATSIRDQFIESIGGEITDWSPSSAAYSLLSDIPRAIDWINLKDDLNPTKFVNHVRALEEEWASTLEIKREPEMTNATRTIKFLSSIDGNIKKDILENIANHYGITPAAAFEEVTGTGAESLLDYITGPTRAAASLWSKRLNLAL